MRDALLLALALVVGIAQQSAAQTRTHPITDLGRYLTDFGPPASVERPRSTRPASEAQAAVLPAALRSRLKPGDLVSVRIGGGEDIVGTISRVTESSLTMTVGGEPREIPADAVQRVVQRRGGNRLWLGMLIGAPLGALCGTYVFQGPIGCTGESIRSQGAARSIAAAAVGAGMGAFIGSKIWRPSTAYEASSTPRTSTPVSSVGSLSAGLRPFDTIYVRRTGAEDIEGIFLGASEAVLTLEDDDERTWEIPAGDVQQVRRRGGTRVLQGLRNGFIIGAGIGLLFQGNATSETRGLWIFLTGFGSIWGTIVGAFVHEHPIVYQAESPAVRLTPVLGLGRRGVMLSIRF